MITFIDITKSILYIQNKSKQKATAERILIQLKKKEQHEDLTLCTLQKEIATLTVAGMLHSNDNNSIFINNILNAPTKEETAVNKESKKNSDINETTKSSPANDSTHSSMKIHELSQIGLKLCKIFFFMKFLISEVK